MAVKAGKVSSSGTAGRPASGAPSSSAKRPPKATTRPPNEGDTETGVPAQPGQSTTTPAGDRGGKSRPTPTPRPSTRGVGVASTANFGAGFVLGLVFWVWVGMPFLRGGPGAVRDQLRAKFFNKDAKGNWLP